MKWALLIWLIATAVFSLGWLLGIVMARSAEAPRTGPAQYCWRCYVELLGQRLGEEQAAAERRGS